MKNSASNPSIIQVLQAQARTMLPIVTQALLGLQYSEIVHQRLAQQTHDIDKQDVENHYYQGLTRAQHSQFGHVMIKWQLNHHDNYHSADLSHEAHVLKSLDNLAQNQSHSVVIAPSVLAYHKIDIQVLGQRQQLTVLVMRYYSSGSLAKQLNGQTHSSLTDAQKYHFIHQAAHLIAKLHHTGWLHNDIKPSNFLLNSAPKDENTNYRIMPNLLMTDFALAAKIDHSTKSNPAGTPAYLAPERWQGQSATIQSDIYAFGIMMVEILMGERPYKISVQSIDPMIDWTTQHCQKPIPKLPSQYSHYQFIVNGALAKRVEKRYKTMEEVLVDLERL